MYTIEVFLEVDLLGRYLRQKYMWITILVDVDIPLRRPKVAILKWPIPLADSSIMYVYYEESARIPFIYGRFLIIPLRRPKVAILKWLIPLALINGPLADSGIQLPVPLILCT